jgi:hypothetical protein
MPHGKWDADRMSETRLSMNLSRALRKLEPRDHQLGNLFWITDAVFPDIDYFLSDELCKRVVAIFEAKVSEATLIGPNDALDILRAERSILKHPVDCH